MLTRAKAKPKKAAHRVNLAVLESDLMSYNLQVSCTCAGRRSHTGYNGSRFLSEFNSGPTFLRLYVTLYVTACFFPGDKSMKYLTCC
jgi:hypothetical protein